MRKIVTPGGETLLVLPLTEYEALIDEAHIIAATPIRADIDAGRDELVPSGMVDRMLAGESLVRVWREHRGLTAVQLADALKLTVDLI